MEGAHDANRTEKAITTMSTTAPTKNTMLFESEVCGRCAGSGSHSYNMRDGSVCYGCGGKGVRLTKRGRVAQAFYTARLTVTVADLRVGDKIRTTGVTLGGGTYYYVAEIVSISEPYVYGSSLRNGEMVPSIGVRINARDAKTGESSIMQTPTTHSVRKIWDAETTKAVTVEALAFQESLTKTGAPKKTAVKR